MPDAEVIPFPLAPAKRLAIALTRLQQAQAEQSAAIELFCAALGRLRDETRQLQRSTIAWDDQVRQVAQDTEAARGAVQALQATAARL